jgi:plasmid stability protein
LGGSFWCSLALVATLLGAGCYRAHEIDVSVDASTDARVDASIDAPVDPPDAARDADAGTSLLVWVLVHPSDAPLGPGLYLFDEGRREILRQLPLPEAVTSPHSLAWDGRSLWLGGSGSAAAVREIDPSDGSVRSEWRGVRTEGIATDGERYWYAAAADGLVQVDRNGTMLSSIGLSDRSVQDLVFAGGALYYLVNDGVDRIVRVDLDTTAATDLARGVHVAPYSLGFDGTHLVVAVEGQARRFDLATGALVRESEFAVPGWITAIAYVR